MVSPSVLEDSHIPSTDLCGKGLDDSKSTTNDNDGVVKWSRSTFPFLVSSLFLGLLFIVLFLSVGIWGYSTFERMDILDAFLNASMILAGMGPVVPLVHPAAKVFAGFYALFSGLAFIAYISIIFSNVLHATSLLFTIPNNNFRTIIHRNRLI